MFPTPELLEDTFKPLQNAHTVREGGDSGIGNDGEDDWLCLRSVLEADSMGFPNGIS